MKAMRQIGDLKSTHITPADGNVFADLGFSPKRAKAMLAEADARIARFRKLKQKTGKLTAPVK